jgi:hypothetical protein
LTGGTFLIAGGGVEKRGRLSWWHAFFILRRLGGMDVVG